MAHQKTITEWCFDNQKKLSLEVKNLLWVNDWIKGLQDFEVSLELNNTKYIGRGSDMDGKIALEKACAEAIERFFMHGKKLFYYASAIHSDIAIANENASSELMERYTFLKMYFENRLTEKDIPSVNVEASIKAKIEERGYFISNQILDSHDVSYTSIHIIEKAGLPKNTFIGLSNSKCYETAKQKSLIEVLQSFTGFLETGIKHDFFDFADRKPKMNSFLNEFVEIDLSKEKNLEGCPAFLSHTIEPYLLVEPRAI